MVESNELTEETKSSVDTGKFLTYNVQLFNLNSSAKDVIESIDEYSPFEAILDNKQSIID